MKHVNMKTEYESAMSGLVEGSTERHRAIQSFCDYVDSLGINRDYTGAYEHGNGIVTYYENGELVDAFTPDLGE